MPKVNFYLQKPKIASKEYLIYMQVKHNAIKFVFSFNEKVNTEYWDINRQRIIDSKATQKMGLVYLNVVLDKLEQHFYKLYYFFCARGKVDFERIRKMLKAYYKSTKAGKSRVKNQADTDELGDSYIKKMLKKNGFSDEIIKNNPEVILLQKEIVKIKRYAKEKTTSKHSRAKI